MPRIQRLSPGLVNKIAAGEVVERPASVVKELMENSIDAGATRIDVAVEAGGIESIRVADNGCGIPAEDLPLAVASHATSKLACEEDLFRIGTLGFRGEALASIAEVSRLVLRSRTADSPIGAELSVSGGRVSPVAPCGCPVGTAVEVRNLFFNTPVRRKFLRSTQTELGHVSEAFLRIALACPQVHLTLRHDHPTDGARRPVFELAGSQGWLERIGLVFGRQLAESLIWVESTDGQVRLSGYVAHPSQSRSNNRMQYLFLNGRAIRDRSLQHALGEAYRGLLMTGRFPIAILSLQMPPELVDVNVHPTKLEVRFQDSSRLYSQLLSTLRAKFLSTDLTARAQFPAEEGPAAAHDEAEQGRLRQELVDWASPN
jgi:DNA mismatch repair protein MutL